MFFHILESVHEELYFEKVSDSFDFSVLHHGYLNLRDLADLRSC